MKDILSPLLVAWAIAVSQTALAKDKTTRQVDEVLSVKASWNYDLAREASYMRSVPAHLRAIEHMRAMGEILDIAEDPINQIADSKTKGIPDTFVANIMFEDAKKQLEVSRQKYGIRWGDWLRQYQKTTTKK
jgi:hypothetical protein